MKNRGKVIHWTDTENTYRYDGKPVTFEWLDDLASNYDEKGKSLLDIHKVSVGRVLFGDNTVQDGETVRFYNPDEFIEYLLTLKGKHVFYFFNIKYDFSFFGKILRKSGFNELHSPLYSGGVITLSFSNGECDIEIIDLQRFTGGSLKSAGEMFACERKKLDFPITCEEDLDKEETRTYLSVDVLLLREIYEKALLFANDLCDIIGVSKDRKLPITAGSFALRVALEKGYPSSSKNKLHKNRKGTFQGVFGKVDKNTDKWFRKFYFGGHGIACIPTYKATKSGFKAGYIKEPQYCDVSSMYPSIMVRFDFPTYKDVKVYDGYQKTDDVYTYGFYEIEVKSEINLPRSVMPSVVKGKSWHGDISLLKSTEDHVKHLYLIDYHNGRSDFKNFLKDYDCKYRVVRSVMCKSQKFSNEFRSYILRLYEMKSEHKSNKGLYSLIKLLLNSLYGKFGQNMAHPRYKVEWNEEMDMYDIIDTGEEDVETDSQLSVAVAAVITMHSRNYLLDIVDEVGAENVILTATDAVVFLSNEETLKAKARLVKWQPIPESQLGTLEFEELDKFALYGTKAYQYITKSGKLVNKCAGMSEKTKNSLVWLWIEKQPNVILKKARTIKGGRYLANTTFKFKETPHHKIRYSCEEVVIYEDD